MANQERFAESDAAFAGWCGHFSSDINGNCMRCAREAEQREAMARAWDEGWEMGGALGDVVPKSANPYRDTALEASDE